MPRRDLHPDDADHGIDVICQLIAARPDRGLLQRDIATPLGITAGAVRAFERSRNQTLSGIQSYYARACGLQDEVHFDGLPEVDSPDADVLTQLAERALKAGDPRRADAWRRAAVMAPIRRGLQRPRREVLADRRARQRQRLVGQPIERGRDDILLSALQRRVCALGGRLRIERTGPATAATAPPIAA